MNFFVLIDCLQEGRKIKKRTKFRVNTVFWQVLWIFVGDKAQLQGQLTRIQQQRVLHIQFRVTNHQKKKKVIGVKGVIMKSQRKHN